MSAALIGGVYWSQWLLLMSVPYLALLTIGSLLIYFLYRRGFDVKLPPLEDNERTPMSGREMRTIAITVGASALWLTDSIHHWHPVVPALLAWILLLMPRIGVLTWSEFERDIGWTNFFVLASSLSLAARAHRERRERMGRAAHRRGRAAVSRPALPRRRDPAGRVGAGAPAHSEHHRLSRHHDPDRDVDRRPPPA